MEKFDLYKDIALRTAGDIYIGIVGPVRTGKSTFIKRFMDLLVIPNIENVHSKERAQDELPQSSAGRTIMTTEPKFVPNEAVEINLDDAVSFKVRLIDCVGYLVKGAEGHLDGQLPRMISTPWADEKIPFTQAAELGTKKVINDHSTIGIVITTDGTITEIEREDYVEAEERVVNELKEIDKPFVMILNTTKPYSPETDVLKQELTEKYNVPVMALNCASLKAEDINSVMEKILYEFPLREVRINFPKWIETLKISHWLKSSIINSVKEMSQNILKLREVKESVLKLEDNEYVKKAFLDKINLGDGSAEVELAVDNSLFYKILSETTGMEINGEYELISTIKVLAEAKREYDKVKGALEEVNRKGYGVVLPAMDEMKLDAPQIVKHGSKYGVKIRATAPSIHLLKCDIETEISPIVGTEKQSEDLINYIATETSDAPEKIWDLNMFGRTMHELVSDGIQNKLYHMPDDAQMKMQEALQKIINEGTGGLICIIL